jgi:hypothetical protein
MPSPQPNRSQAGSAAAQGKFGAYIAQLVSQPTERRQCSLNTVDFASIQTLAQPLAFAR